MSRGTRRPDPRDPGIVRRRVAVAPCVDCGRGLDHCHDAWLLLDELCADPDCRLPIEAHAVLLEPAPSR